MTQAYRIEAEHGIVLRLAGEEEPYLGWPSAAILEDGRIAVGASGPRRYHVDPWGKTALVFGDAQGNFEPVQVVHNSPLDDRDVGVVALSGNRLLMTWFTLDSRYFWESLEKDHAPGVFAQMRETMDSWTGEDIRRHRGSWCMLSTDGGKTWREPARCPVSTPHGPIELRDGWLAYLGKQFHEDMDRPFGQLSCAVSEDGEHWTELGQVPLPEGKHIDQFHEPHVVELKDGTLLGVIRYHYTREEGGGLGLYQTRSTDGGKTWSVAQDMNILGAPPHLLMHSSGALILTYGYRREGCGQRVRISRDQGITWGEEMILRDDGPDGDLGYPCTVELPDGSLFTVYYQKCAAGEDPSILYSHWSIGPTATF